MNQKIVLVFFALVLGLVASCNPYRFAWPVTATVREAAFQTEAAIAKSLRDKVKECSQKYAVAILNHNNCVKACDTSAKPGTKEHDDCKTACHKTHEVNLVPYTACVKPNYEANDAWIKYARPSINSALTITVASLQLAESTKNKKLSWMEYLLPAMCTLAEALQQWKDILPANVKSLIMTAVGAVTAATCKK